MLLVTGDTHAEQYKYIECISPYLHKHDTLFIAGDFGYGWWDGEFLPQEMFFDFIASRPYTVCFVDGNHEDHHKLNELPVMDWNGGKAHIIRHNLIHLMRGEIYNIEGKKIFVMGGGYSLDKDWRTPGISWFLEEMPSEAEYLNAEANLLKNDNKVDYIITHTCPTKIVEYLSSVSVKGVNKNVFDERPLNDFLQNICERVDFKHHYFGHFHMDYPDMFGKHTAIYNCIRRLDNGKIIRRWDM